MCSLARQLVLTFAVSALCSAYLSAQRAAAVGPIRIKVVIVTMFERGGDTDDTPGEFQLWVEREHLDQILPLPSGYHQVRLNKDGVLGIVTGVGTAKAAASVMALGLDPRFELSKPIGLLPVLAAETRQTYQLGRRFGRITLLMATWRLRSMRDKFQKAGRLLMYHYKKEVLTSNWPATSMAKRTH